MSTDLVVVRPVAESFNPSPDNILKAAHFVAKNPLQSQAQAEKCLQLLETVQALGKQVEEAYGPSVKAAHEAHKTILAAKKKYSDILEEAEKLIRSAINKWVSTQKAEGVNNPLPGVTPRSTWSFTVEDLSLVPREYLMVDEKKVEAIVKAMKEQTNIPGIKAFEKTTVAVKRKVEENALF